MTFVLPHCIKQGQFLLKSCHTALLTIPLYQRVKTISPARISKIVLCLLVGELTGSFHYDHSRAVHTMETQYSNSIYLAKPCQTSHLGND